MKTYTMRLFLENGMVIDKLSTTNDRDAHIQEYLARGLRTTDGSCLIIYPARLIERIEVYEQGRAPALGKKDAKVRTGRPRGGSARSSDGDVS